LSEARANHARAGGEGQIVASEEEIAFENACVVTPANATLVRDLTLRVPAGTNLLVTGPNGSGAQWRRFAACHRPALGLDLQIIPWVA
jgi:ABC-type uncharacterized transport system fused permease/ATPase subunit